LGRWEAGLGRWGWEAGSRVREVGLGGGKQGEGVTRGVTSDD